MITTYHNISFGTQTVPEQIPVVQGDTGREIVFILTDFTIPEGATATYYVQKPSGEAVYNTATISENNIIVPLTAQSIIEVGENDMQVRVILDEDIVTSFRAILMVRPFLGIGAVESSTEINIFDQAVEAAKEEFQTEAEAIVEEVIESIPEDYTALSNEVNELKTDFTAELKVFEDGAEQLLSGGMLTGSINADGTIDASIKYRAYTPTLQKYNRDILLHINSPATGFFLCLYDNSGNFVSRTSYGVDTTVSANTYFKVCAFASSDTDQNVLYRSITFTSLIKTLSDELNDLDDWEDYKQYALANGVVLFNGEYINASVNSSGVVDTSITFRVTTKDIIHNVYPIYVRVKDGWQVWLTTYQQDGTFIERTNKQSGIFSIPANSYFRITIGQTNEASGRADIKTFILNVFVANSENNIPIRKWVAIGDSMTEVNQTATKRYCDYVAENLNLELINMGVGGTGYKNGSDNSKSFYQRVQNAPTDADVYTFFGSGNDGASTLNNFPIGNPTDTGTNSICGCVNTALDNLYALNPNAVVGVITPTPWAIWPPYGVENTGATLPAQDPAWMQKYSDALVSICKRRGIPCLDLYHCSAMRPWEETFRTLFYSKDGNNGVHPDENGHKYFIAPHIQEFIKTLIQYP